MTRRFALAAVILCVSCWALRPDALLAAANATVRAHIQISVCGNAFAEGDEECDGADVRGRTCQALGFGGGVLSCAIDCSFDTSQCVAASGSTQSGGGSGPSPVIQPVVTQVIFSGQAYPASRLTLLKDGQIAAVAIADASGAFTASVTGLAGGGYQFSVYAEDAQGRRSPPLSFPLQVESGTVTKVSQIMIAPTVETEDAGDGLLTVRGQSQPGALIYDAVDQVAHETAATAADGEGEYLFQVDIGTLPDGPHDIAVKAELENVATAYGSASAFVVKKSEAKTAAPAAVDSDVNGDGRIDLVDFSIMAFWYGASSPPRHADLNGDGRVDLTDFSILAYYWTG